MKFREEIFARYLLTQGDALGGKMRNWVGAMAQGKLTSAIQQSLGTQATNIHTKRSGKIDRIAWANRRLVFDVKPKFIGKNIDVILLSASPSEQNERDLLEQSQRYLACGELKGGIDPGGTDEHWKTASSAFQRIRSSSPFAGGRPALFFVGAAIMAAQAKEAFEQLTDGRLSYAANLTVSDQVQALAEWLVGL